MHAQMNQSIKRNHLHAIYMGVFKRVKKVDAYLVCLEEANICGSLLAHPAKEIRWGMVRDPKE